MNGMAMMPYLYRGTLDILLEYPASIGSLSNHASCFAHELITTFLCNCACSNCLVSFHLQVLSLWLGINYQLLVLRILDTRSWHISLFRPSSKPDPVNYVSDHNVTWLIFSPNRLASPYQ
jgi:hypothetical protein